MLDVGLCLEQRAARSFVHARDPGEDHATPAVGHVPYRFEALARLAGRADRIDDGVARAGTAQHQLCRARGDVPKAVIQSALVCGCALGIDVAVRTASEQEQHGDYRQLGDVSAHLMPFFHRGSGINPRLVPMHPETEALAQSVATPHWIACI